MGFQSGMVIRFTVLVALAVLAPTGVGSAQPRPRPATPATPEQEEPTAAEDDLDADASGATEEGAVAADDADADEDLAEVYEPTTELRAPRTVCEGRTIRRIRVRGGRRVAEEDIRATLELREDVPCTDLEVSRDARALWDMGFFDDIVVTAAAVGDDLIDLLFEVRERPAIGRIVFEGNDEIDDGDLDEKVTLREGEVLSVPEVRRQVTRIRDLYAEKGYFLARIRYRLSRMPNNEVEIKFVIAEGDEVTVRRISFVGNAHIPASELLGFMQTSQTGFFSFLSSSDTFNREHFEEDVGRLQALYYDRGYLAINVGTPRIELTPDRQHIDVTIPIDEGPRFHIGRLRVAEVDAEGEEVEPLGGRRRLRDQIEANPGDWFSRTTVAQNLLEVTRFYRDRGYAQVEMVPQTDLDMRRRVVHVVISIRRGPLVRIERINIRGNSKTRDLVIRREIQIAEGALYSQTDVERSKARIQALGYFERVDLSEEEGSAPDRIVLNFEVAERATGQFQVGAGFSSIESFIFTAQIQQQNLFGRGQSLALQLQLSGIRQLAQIRFVEPYLLDTEWSLAADAFKTIRQFQDFNRDSTGGGLTLGHPILLDELSLFLNYRAEYVDISSRTGGLFGSAGSGAGFNIFRRLPLANLFRDGLTSSLQLSLTWDTRDNRLFPTSGLYASVSSELADTYLGSENVFLRHRAFVRVYRQLFGSFVLKLNTEWGLVSSREPEGVPIFERFFLGGIFNVRGFGLNALGPRAGLPTSTDPNARVSPQGVVFGGNMQLFYNLELEFPIIESVGIRGVIFTDGGNAWNLESSLCGAPPPEQFDSASDPCGVDLLNLRTSWGFGLRWISPLGPLRFEWGLPFNPRAYEKDILFEFTIGNFF